MRPVVTEIEKPYKNGKECDRPGQTDPRIARDSDDLRLEFTVLVRKRDRSTARTV